MNRISDTKSLVQLLGKRKKHSQRMGFVQALEQFENWDNEVDHALPFLIQRKKEDHNNVIKLHGEPY